MYNLYDTFTIDEANSIGAKFSAKCVANYGYEDHLTEDKVYDIEITPRILIMSPLCKVIGDKGKVVECHITRFEKIQSKGE